MKTKILNLFIVLFLLLGIHSAKAQGNFVKAYMINAKGDTVKGEVKINPKKEFDHYFKITFKDEAGAQKNYKPTKIKGYGFDNKNFISWGEDDEAMFYERLTNGPIILYKSCFMSVHMNKEMREAAYYLHKEGDKKMTDVKEDKFKKQLQEWMSGAAGFAGEYTEEKKFNEESAIAVINKYNDWKKSN
jgi:hypothetical protein